MSESHNPTELLSAAQDIAPLAWIIDEIRASLAQAVTGSKTFVASKNDLESLRAARNHVHQAHGALQLLDLRGVALLTESIESLLRRWESEPKECMPSAVKTLETATAALTAYLEGLLAGRPNQPIRLYPYYRDILTLNRAARVHPADLLFADLSRRPAFHQIEVRPLTADQLRVRRVVFEEGLLGFLRDAEDAKARRRMRDALVDLERLPQRGLARSFWWTVRGLLEALDARQVQVDVDLKRVLARLNLQLRRLIDGGAAVAERLMLDTLYYVGRAGDEVPRVVEIKRLYGLEALIPADFERATLTTVDAEALRALREALAGAKTHWGQLVAGNAADAARFVHEIGLARAAVGRLQAAPLARLLDAVAEATCAAPAEAAQRESLGLEVASALLLVELGADDLPNVDAELPARAETVAARLAAAARGRPLPESAAWIGELARRAQDRLTMGSVVAETQTTLREIEQRLDRFFRRPGERGELLSTVPLFDQVCGVLSVLGHDEPVSALRQVQQLVKNFANPAVEARPDEFQRIAQSLGAIGFFVETLTQDGEQRRSMFHYDPASGLFSADLGQSPVTEQAAAPADDWPAAAETVEAPLRSPLNVEAAAAQHRQDAHGIALHLAAAPLDNAALQLLARLLPQLSAEADLLDDTDLKERIARAGELLARLRAERRVEDAQELAALFAPEPETAVEPSAPLPGSQAAADRELLAIFVEEANEVLDDLAALLARLRADPADQATLTTARRAFHTLKGSSRMVGLKQFGEAAWAVEQCFNLWLAQERPASADLLDLGQAIAAQMRDWIARIARDPRADLAVAGWVGAAQRVREGSAFESPVASRPPAASDPKGCDSAAPEAPTALSSGVGAGVWAASEDLVLDADALIADTVIAADEPPPAASAAAPTEAAAPLEPPLRDDLRRIGPIEISHGLYSVFLAEADEAIRLLAQDIAEWRFEPLRAVSGDSVRRAHSLAGISGTVGLKPVWAIVDPLDDALHALQRLAGEGEAALSPAQFDALERVLERVRGMLHQFAAGIYPEPAVREEQAVRALLDEINARLAAQVDALLVAHPPLAGPLAAEVEFIVAQPLADEPVAIEAAAGAAPVAAAQPEATAPAQGAPAAGSRSEGDEALFAAAAPADAEAPPPEALAGGDDQTPAEVAADLGVRDELDADLLPVFLAEAGDLMPAIAANLRALDDNPNERAVARELMRQLHTVKGSARMAGAMRLGELVHDMETRIESAMQLAAVPNVIVDDLHGQYDRAMHLYEALLRPAAAQASAPAAPAQEAAASEPGAEVIDLASARDGRDERPAAEAAARASANAPAAAPAASFIRVRADVLDKLVDQAGEVSIARARLENELGTLKGGLADLTENVSRLRSQLREVEIQAEAQIAARADRLDRASAAFDPLEYDRYTRLQELTRLLAESVEDVAMVQANMLKGLQLADTDLGAQSRLTRELQQQLMRVRLVPFANISERLYRVARQTAKELDKRVSLEIRGGATEIDRGVLERMGGPFEHLVRNAIVHGLETPAERRAAGKPETGELAIEVRQEGNEIVVACSDDGAGLDLARIRRRAVDKGLLGADQPASDRELMELVFAPGFSTAAEVTELAGRGVGMDVVRTELASFGGRVAIASEPGRGARFTLYLPLTLAVTQVVLATVGQRRYAIPAGMVEQVRRLRPAPLVEALARGELELAPIGAVVLRPLAQLLGEEVVLHQGRQAPVVLLRSGEDRLAVYVEDLSSNVEVVVKSVGPQVSRLAGILGATILGSGEIVLIVNPVQLIARSPEPWQPAGGAAAAQPATAVETRRAEERARAFSGEARSLIMVVDDSLTVRRVTQRLLERNGYDVMLAKDGVDALRQLQDARPDVMLVDIEMPRMDGFDLTRNVRAGASTRTLPIVMITSRTADKHRKVAFEVGVNHYLGKPYQEEELLQLIRRYLSERAIA
jgi:chemosensory pili system protein ChpA (sensor histidine kinase/response regulator)